MSERTERVQLQALVRKWRESRSVLVQGCASELARVIAFDQPALPLPTGAHPEPVTPDFVRDARVLLAEHRGPLTLAQVEPLLREIAARHR